MSEMDLLTSNKPATLNDVARLANVNKSTVSRVLRSDPSLNVRAETRDRITTIARELGYQPNIIARSLRVARSFTLGLIALDEDDPRLNQVVRSVQRCADQHGYSLLIGYLDRPLPGQRLPQTGVIERMVLGNRVDGALIHGLDAGDDRLEPLRRLNTPFIGIEHEGDAGRRATLSLIDWIEGGKREQTLLANRPLHLACA